MVKYNNYDILIENYDRNNLPRAVFYDLLFKFYHNKPPVWEGEFKECVDNIRQSYKSNRVKITTVYSNHIDGLSKYKYPLQNRLLLDKQEFRAVLSFTDVTGLHEEFNEKFIHRTTLYAFSASDNHFWSKKLITYEHNCYEPPSTLNISDKTCIGYREHMSYIDWCDRQAYLVSFKQLFKTITYPFKGQYNPDNFLELVNIPISVLDVDFGVKIAMKPFFGISKVIQDFKLTKKGEFFSLI